VTLKVGLTGGIASGKSTICQIFSNWSVPIIDADIIARNLVQPGQSCLDAIVEAFGPTLLQNDGHLDRQALRAIIFSDITAKRQLESILHPKITQELQLQSSRVDTDYCIVAIPLLIEAGLQNSVDRILVIDIDSQIQLSRLCLRDNLLPEEAQKIINAQCSREDRLHYADDIIVNDSNTTHLEASVNKLHAKYKRLANSLAIGCQLDNSQRQ